MPTDCRTLATRLAAAILVAAGPLPTLAQPPSDPALLVQRIAALSWVEGRVELADASGTLAAAVNWPLAAGNRLTTDASGRAEVVIGTLVLRADGDSAIFFERVDDAAIRVLIERGSVGLTLRNPAQLAAIEIGTARERIVFEQPGRYRIDVDRLPAATTVTAFAGGARVNSTGLSVVISAGQRGEFRGAPATSFLLLGAAPDAFDAWVLARDTATDAYAPAPYVATEATGALELANYGAWQEVPQYGPLWFPTAVDWVPYRSGRWVHAGPWGRTWIDTAPWGFVTTRYGHWVFIGGRWGWRPYRSHAPIHRPLPYPPPRAWVDPRPHPVAPPLPPRPPYPPPRPTPEPTPPPPMWRVPPQHPPRLPIEHPPSPPVHTERRYAPLPAAAIPVATPPAPAPAPSAPPPPAVEHSGSPRLHIAPPPSVRLPPKLRDDPNGGPPPPSDPRGRVKAAIP